MKKLFLILACLSFPPAGPLVAFSPDLSDQPSTHPPLTPVDGEEVLLNPPPMIWREDERASAYIVELSESADFSGELIRVEEIDLPFYNHSETLSAGTWHWRYRVVDEGGNISDPAPAKTFVVTGGAVPFPVPPSEEMIAGMPDHPRIFTAPDQLDEFRERRKGPGRYAWEEIEWRAERALGEAEPERPELFSLDEKQPEGRTPGSNSWQPGDETRRQVFFMEGKEAYFAPEYSVRDLNGIAGRASTLSFAFLVSGDEKYADAARDLAVFLADARIDYHVENRASHDTVVYAYEHGLRDVALSFDRLYDRLTDEEREKVIRHIEYHGEAAYEWLRDRIRIHVEYQRSHPQQAMHSLLPAVLAIATHSEPAAVWTDYLVRQYANRIAWTSPDGGYFEGQTYGHKFQWILEGLLAMRTATGIDAFRKPHVRNSGEFWLYCMSLNYWYEHGGDIYSLLWPWGNPADGYISNLMAAVNRDPYVQWWADTVYADPVHVPFQFLSDTDIDPRPPVDIPQARLFEETGQLAAYDRFYDHGSPRLFFRSSQWGGHSHAHADQNNFVIHHGHEILAPDVGYYTYYGDDYHMQWSVTTNTHNSILVNGEGQPKSIDSKGEITRFFQSPEYTFFVGDASEAYEEHLTDFRRAILFVRPDVYIVFDELASSEPAEYSWLLNTFSEPEIDERSQAMVVPQQGMRLKARHLVPDRMTYRSSNERRYPMQTRAWTRYTEAFPEPWHTRVNTREEAETNILAFLHSYEEEAGERVSAIEEIGSDSAVGVRFMDTDVEEFAAFRRALDDSGSFEIGGVETDGVAFSMAAGRRYMLAGGSYLRNEESLLELPGEGYAYAGLSGKAGSLLWVDCGQPGEIRVRLEDEPRQVFRAPPNSPEAAEEADFSWEAGELILSWDGRGKGVFWIDPATDPRALLPVRVFAVSDDAGDREEELDAGVADNGDWIYFTSLDPREPGVYEVIAEGAEILVQDRWEPVKTRAGENRVEAVLREGTEIFFRYPRGVRPGDIEAALKESHAGELINILRNGDFEEGLPGFPPRGWTVSRSSHTENPGWPGWSREGAYEGEGVLRFSRPVESMHTQSQPMRLLRGGTYVLRFMARGEATHASVGVQHSRGGQGSVSIEPSGEWRFYEREFDLPPGYCRIAVRFAEGGEDNQVVWVDAIEFGRQAGTGEDDSGDGL